MVVSKSWFVTNVPDGMPKKNDFTLKEEKIPPCEDGDVLVETEYISVDPYLRILLKEIPVNSVMTGTAVCRVIESKHKDWPVGSYLVCHAGWRTKALIKKETLDNPNFFVGCTRLPELKGLPGSLGLGVLGMPGNTAYFGFLELCQPRVGDTVLVSGAAGAVGSMVVQIAKLKGCKVIGIAGSDAKVAYLKKIGADHAINYKTMKIGEVLQRVAPEKIDCYYDNVGGHITAEILPHMALRGRVAVGGAISTYNEKPSSDGKVPLNGAYNENILYKQLRVEGLLVDRWTSQWKEGIAQIREWILEGKIKYKETVTNGFDKVPCAFVGLFTGENIGKAVVKV